MNRRDIGQQSESAGGQADAENVELVGHIGAAAMYTPSTVRRVDGKPRSMDQIGAAAIHAVTVQADYAYAVAQYLVPGHKERYTVYRGLHVVGVSDPTSPTDPAQPPADRLLRHAGVCHGCMPERWSYVRGGCACRSLHPAPHRGDDRGCRRTP
jgi:hypothetical protein